MSDLERPRAIRLEEHELRSLVQSTVKETLATMGVDASNPIEMQKDFHHLREWREATGKVRMRIILTVVGIIVTGLMGMVALALFGK